MAKDASAATPAGGKNIDFQALRRKAEIVIVPFWNAMKTYAEHSKKGYKEAEEKLHEFVHKTKRGDEWEDRDGPLDLVIISIRTPTITPKMTSYFLHCCTVSAVALAWKLVTGTSPKLVVAATAYVLFEPFCAKVSDFKKDYPKAFAMLWGASWIGMCSGHQLLFSSTTMFTNKIFKGEFSAGVSFLIASAAMSYFMMMPVERIKNYLQKISKEPSKDGVEMRTAPHTPASNKDREEPKPTPMLGQQACATTSFMPDSTGGLGDSICCKPAYTPVLCFAEGWAVDNIKPYLDSFNPYLESIVGKFKAGASQER